MKTLSIGALQGILHTATDTTLPLTAVTKKYFHFPQKKKNWSFMSPVITLTQLSLYFSQMPRSQAPVNTTSGTCWQEGEEVREWCLAHPEWMWRAASTTSTSTSTSTLQRWSSVLPIHQILNTHWNIFSLTSMRNWRNIQTFSNVEFTWKRYEKNNEIMKFETE